tara:strand:+ start:2946 stop:5105 length:2160 start_codon:yes stop_codon:yes gene_type:complete
MVIDVIPPQLRNDNFRFCLVRSKRKVPFEKSWQKDSNYNYNSQELVRHLDAGGNIGVIAGYGNLLVIDADTLKIANKVKDVLSPTFSVRSGRGFHFYYICSDLHNLKQIKICDGDSPSHVFPRDHQVLVPPSIHPSGRRYEIDQDLAIAPISAEDILMCFREDTIMYSTIYNNKKVIDNNKINIDINKVLAHFNVSGLTNNGVELYGSHPIHGSTNGNNFWVNTETNNWFCFRCQSGGSSLHLIAVLGKKVECHELNTRQLRGDLFVKVYELAKRNNLVTPQEIKKFRMTNVSNSLTVIADEKRNWLTIIEDFHNEWPFFFDRSRIWWIWNKQKMCYEHVDDIDMMNLIDDVFKSAITIRRKNKEEILEAMRRVGRRNIPIDLKNSIVQYIGGSVDLATGESLSPSPKMRYMNPLPWKLGESENTPTIDTLFLQWVGAKYVQTLYEIVAFCTTRKYFIHRLICLNGHGRNGKSSYIKLIEKLLGFDNYTSSSIERLTGGASRFEGSNLYGKLLCSIGELNFENKRNTSILKSLAGEDTQVAEFKKKNPFNFINYAKILIATNAVPSTKDKSDGWYSRWMCIDFPNQFAEKTDVLASIPDWEFENLVKKSIRIAKELWEKREFTNEGSIEERRARYEKRSNPVARFLVERCIKEQGTYCLLNDFMVEFEEFCDAEKIQYRPTRQEIGKQLSKDFDHERKRMGNEEKQTVYFGFILRSRNK